MNIELAKKNHAQGSSSNRFASVSPVLGGSKTTSGAGKPGYCKFRAERKRKISSDPRSKKNERDAQSKRLKRFTGSGRASSDEQGQPRKKLAPK